MISSLASRLSSHAPEMIPASVLPHARLASVRMGWHGKRQWVVYRGRVLNVVPNGDPGSPFLLRGMHVSYDVRPVDNGLFAAFRWGMGNESQRVPGLTFRVVGDRLELP